MSCVVNYQKNEEETNQWNKKREKYLNDQKKILKKTRLPKAKDILNIIVKFKRYFNIFNFFYQKEQTITLK